MVEINWGEAEEKGSANFKPYADDGKYELTLNEVKVEEVGQNGSIAVKFKFEEDEQYAYPEITHWLSFKNDNWRYWHYKEIFAVLGGLDDATAKKTISVCETGDKEKTIQAYQKAFTKLASKHPKVKVEVYTETGSNGKDYARGEFQDPRIAMGKDSKKSKASSEISLSESAVDINPEDVPF